MNWPAGWVPSNYNLCYGGLQGRAPLHESEIVGGFIDTERKTLVGKAQPEKGRETELLSGHHFEDWPREKSMLKIGMKSEEIILIEEECRCM
jgi:hypothetical protein